MVIKKEILLTDAILNKINESLVLSGDAILQKHTDKIYLMVSYIAHSSIIKDDYNFSVQVPSQKFRKTLGKRYFDKIMKFLIQYDIIIYDSETKYSVGNHCKYYKINPIIHTSNDKFIKITLSDITLVANIIKMTKKNDSISDKSNENDIIISDYNDEISKIIMKHFVKSEIDYIGASKWIDEYFTVENIKQVMEDKNKNKRRKNKIVVTESLVNELKNNAKHFVESMKSGDIYSVDEFKISNSNGRLHYPLNSVKRELRKFVIGYEYEVDASNCQWLLLYALMMQDNKDLNQYLDVKLLGELVQSGTFYEYLMEQYNTDDRDSIKDFALTLLCSPNHWESNKIKRFKELFPNVSKYLYQQKKGKDGNSIFAKLLHSTEGMFFLPLCVKILKNGYSVHSCHNAIGCSMDDINTVSEAITTEFKKQFNLNMNLKIKQV